MILGLGGYAGAGKDAFADCMMNHNAVWKKTYMSYALEQALLALDPYVDGNLTRYSELHSVVGYTDSKNNQEVRRLLQRLGTEVGRSMFGENVWVDKMMDVASEHAFVIVTGIRYPNEIDAVVDSGGTTAWVSRPGVGPINSHSSDNTVKPDLFDHHIENDGSLEDLQIIAARFSDRIISIY